jgi:hypothetical protein
VTEQRARKLKQAGSANCRLLRQPTNETVTRYAGDSFMCVSCCRIEAMGAGAAAAAASW